MKISGESLINAPIATVWQTLADPQQISQCMPGLSGWEIIEPDKQFKLFVIWGEDEAPRLRVPITLTWAEVDEPRYMFLTSAILVGTAVTNATGTLNLKPATLTQTTIHFTATIDAPNQMVDQIARTLAPTIANTFFKNLQKAVS